VALNVAILAKPGCWKGDCFVIRGAGGNEAPVVFDIGAKSLVQLAPPETRLVVLSHDDSDHINGAAAFFETQCQQPTTFRNIKPELWVPYEWSWAYRALLGLRDGGPELSGDAARIVRAHAEDALGVGDSSAPVTRREGDGPDRPVQPAVAQDDAGNRDALRDHSNSDEPGPRVRGADRREEHVLLDRDRIIDNKGRSDEPARGRGSNREEKSPSPDILPWLRRESAADIAAAVAAVVSQAVVDAQSRAELAAHRREDGNDVVGRTAASAARTATVVALAIRAGWNIRCFSYTAAQAVAGSRPYESAGNTKDFTIVNAREVDIAWQPLGDQPILFMAAARLTVQNRRSLVGLASDERGDPRALFWADSSGDFICDGIMPPDFRGLFTAPHHGSGNRSHDPVWRWRRERAHNTQVVSTRHDRVRHLRTDFWTCCPLHRAATFCGTDPRCARAVHWTGDSGFDGRNICTGSQSGLCSTRGCCMFTCS
jgi:hypothetical protein